MSVYGALEAFSARHLDESKLLTCKHIHFSGYFQCKSLQSDATIELWRWLRARGIRTSLTTQSDASGRYEREGGHLKRFLQEQDIFIPNDQEAMKITATASSSVALESLCNAYPLVLMVVTCGPDGVIAGRGTGADAKRWHIAAHDRLQLVDTLGAGDTFSAGFLSKFVITGDVEKSLRYGCAAAAVAVERTGGPAAFSFTSADVEEMLKR